METLRAIRERNYLSRRSLADLAGVSASTILRMEEGQGRTTEEVATKVLRALGDKICEELFPEDVEGLKLYNIMRDRRQRTKTTNS